MSKVCAIFGKRPVKGRIIHRKGQAKKAGGIGTHVTKKTRRTFRPNLQRIRIRMENGSVQHTWVCVKAIKAGKIVKA